MARVNHSFMIQNYWDSVSPTTRTPTVPNQDGNAIGNFRDAHTTKFICNDNHNHVNDIIKRRTQCITSGNHSTLNQTILNGNAKQCMFQKTSPDFVQRIHNGSMLTFNERKWTPSPPRTFPFRPPCRMSLSMALWGSTAIGAMSMCQSFNDILMIQHCQHLHGTILPWMVKPWWADVRFPTLFPTDFRVKAWWEVGAAGCWGLMGGGCDFAPSSHRT